VFLHFSVTKIDIIKIKHLELDSVSASQDISELQNSTIKSLRGEQYSAMKEYRPNIIKQVKQWQFLILYSQYCRKFLLGHEPTEHERTLMQRYCSNSHSIGQAKHYITCTYDCGEVFPPTNQTLL
jgi:hypothetical protein